LCFEKEREGKNKQEMKPTGHFFFVFFCFVDPPFFIFSVFYFPKKKKDLKKRKA